MLTESETMFAIIPAHANNILRIFHVPPLIHAQLADVSRQKMSKPIKLKKIPTPAITIHNCTTSSSCWSKGRFAESPLVMLGPRRPHLSSHEDFIQVELFGMGLQDLTRTCKTNCIACTGSWGSHTHT